MNAESVAAIPEGRLLRILYGDPMCRGWILPSGIDVDHRALFDTPLSALVNNEAAVQGDIDLLVVQAGRAHESIALQFKRVKVDGDTFATGLANKLHEIRKLAKQTNLLVKHGFHRVYATVLVLVDSRDIGGVNPWLNSTPGSVIQAVNAGIGSAGFDPAIWVESVEICQPFDVDFRERGSSGGRMLQVGCARAQPDNLTRALSEWLASAA